MDFNKHPHHRGGNGSNTGDRQARLLDSLGAPALRHRNLDGTVSVKVGERLYVDPTSQVVIENLFTSGLLVSGQSGVFTSDSPLRGFKPRGRLPFSSVEGGNFQDQGYIASHSDATGYVADNQFTGFTPDFDVAANAGGGSTLTMAAIVTGAVYRTRNGAAFSTDFTAYSCRAIPEAMSGSILDSVRVMPGQYVLVDGVRTGFRGASFVTLEALDGLGAGHYWPNFLGIKRDNTGWNGELLGLPYTMIAMHQLLVLGPGRYMLVMRCMRSVRRPTLCNNLSIPVAVAQITKDAGQTWDAVGSLAAASDEFATVMAFPQQVGDGAGVGESDRYAKYFNDASFYTSFSAAAPISATRSLALMMVTYNDYANSGGEVVPGQPMIGKLRTRIKVVRIDTAGAGSITEAQTVFHGRQLEGAASLGDVLPTGDGMLFWLRDVEADAPDENTWQQTPNKPCKIYFTANGADLQFVGYMPFPAYRTGVPCYIDAQTIACPMYVDGAHWLYLSRDRMATWSRGALITRSGSPPVINEADPISSATMRNFAKVTRLCTDTGAPINSHPQAPWIMDCAFQAPQ